jgi:hypothetical protein
MEEELEKLCQDLLTNRQTYRGQTLTVSPPQPHQNLIDNPFMSYDFASLYPSVQKKYYYKISMKVAIRKRKIINIFQ